MTELEEKIEILNTALEGMRVQLARTALPAKEKLLQEANLAVAEIEGKSIIDNKKFTDDEKFELLSDIILNLSECTGDMMDRVALGQFDSILAVVKSIDPEFNSKATGKCDVSVMKRNSLLTPKK